MTTDFPIWTIFDSPRDLPGYIVVRPFYPQPDGTVRASATAQIFAIGHDKERALAEARAFCAARAPVQLTRQPGDDPNIVETWL